MNDRPGTLLGQRYRLAFSAGVGAMARVWAATDVTTGERVAVKRILENARDPQDAASRFLDEIRISRTLEHPHVVAGLDHGVDDGAFLVLEWVEGTDAHALVTRRERLTPGAAAAVALDPTDALVAVHGHRNGVLHRDITPGNVLLARDGRAFLADFGLARALACPRAQPAHLAAGKLAYLPPEVLRGRVHGVRADLYGLGVTLWELLAGRRLWAHVTEPAARSHAWLFARRPALRDCADVPKHLATVVDGCLATDPKHRPSNASALRRALDEALVRDRVQPDRAALGEAVWTATRNRPKAMPATRVRRSRANYVTVSSIPIPDAIRARRAG